MRTITLSHPDEAVAALRNPNLAQALYDEGAVIMEDVLLVLHGDAHRSRRMLEFKVFRRNFFRWYETEVFPRTLEETIASAVAAGWADLVDLGYRVTMNLTADFAGIDRPQRSAQETEALLKLVVTFSEGATLVHSRRNREEVRGEVRHALEKFDKTFLAPSIARRQALLERFRAGEIAEDALPRDVLTVLLRNEDQLDMPPDVLRREIAFYLQAGAHSTANSTTHAMHEIFNWRRAHPEDGERMKRDPLFVQRCVHESLRLHPASPVSWRKPVCPISLDGAGELSESDLVVIDLAASNRDPGAFGPTAHEFDPHRAIPTGRLPFGLTFGSGPHACLGRDLDGGVLPIPTSTPETHQYGIVTLFVRRLLAEGARPDSSDPPTEATYTQRPNWGRYPVVFDPELRWPE